jgi:hypothetical protein
MRKEDMLLWYPMYLASACVYLNWTRCAIGEALNSGCSASAAYSYRGMSGKHCTYQLTEQQQRCRKE